MVGDYDGNEKNVKLLFITYSISEWRASASVAESLGSTNSFYHSSISSLSTH
jgi:hypothetical protein